MSFVEKGRRVLSNQFIGAVILQEPVLLYWCLQIYIHYSAGDSFQPNMHL